MSRNKKERAVDLPPLFTSFKPVGIAGRYLENIVLTLDEYEAIRLVDYLGFNHIEAAESMCISRPTFTRLLEKARHKLSKMLITGSMVSIGGGNVHFKKNIIKCNNCEQMFKININEYIDRCPNCNSEEIYNMAGGFGHGRCCTDFFNTKTKAL